MAQWLRIGIVRAVALVAVVCAGSTPGLGTSTCPNATPPPQKKPKQKTAKQNKNILRKILLGITLGRCADK